MATAVTATVASAVVGRFIGSVLGTTAAAAVLIATSLIAVAMTLVARRASTDAALDQ